MRHLALALICLGFTAGAIYQQVHHFDSGTLGVGAFVAFILVLIPDDVATMLLVKIKKEFD